MPGVSPEISDVHAAIFEALPGLDVPVDAISTSLAKMWEDTAAHGGAAPAEMKATQLNFVLHFGFRTTVEDALEQHKVMLRFAQRYPCRVVILCPLGLEDRATEMRAKIYGECFLGKSKGDARCVEFVALCYPQSSRQFLENEVSICLSTDLPLYYWAHRFADMSRLSEYHYLLRTAKRILIDSATAPADALTHPWPRPEAVRDLAHARLLHVRQSIGQFLACFSPETIARGLREVVVVHAADLAAEGNVLLGWARVRLQACGAPADARYAVEPRAKKSSGQLELRFRYVDGRSFSWAGDFSRNASRFEADLSGERVALPSTADFLPPESALSEAIFF